MDVRRHVLSLPAFMDCRQRRQFVSRYKRLIAATVAPPRLEKLSGEEISLPCGMSRRMLSCGVIITALSAALTECQMPLCQHFCEGDVAPTQSATNGGVQCMGRRPSLDSHAADQKMHSSRRGQGERAVCGCSSEAGNRAKRGNQGGAPSGRLILTAHSAAHPTLV